MDSNYRIRSGFQVLNVDIRRGSALSEQLYVDRLGTVRYATWLCLDIWQKAISFLALEKIVLMQGVRQSKPRCILLTVIFIMFAVTTVVLVGDFSMSDMIVPWRDCCSPEDTLKAQRYDFRFLVRLSHNPFQGHVVNDHEVYAPYETIRGQGFHSRPHHATNLHSQLCTVIPLLPEPSYPQELCEAIIDEVYVDIITFCSQTDRD
ncbi:hypothetical protein C8J56DRAFT_1039583 [Mycena floridula]|nr:hypothetical protein C8J56DRAFT_1039583 [Mycena floridula]